MTMHQMEIIILRYCSHEVSFDETRVISFYSIIDVHPVVRMFRFRRDSRSEPDGF